MKIWLADKLWYLTFWTTLALIFGALLVRLYAALTRIAELLEQLVRTTKT